jgi:hypothetical protein
LPTSIGQVLARPFIHHGKNTMKTTTGQSATLPRFPLGKLVATPGALRLLEQHKAEPFDYILRHVGGDYGALDAEDVAANEAALKSGLRVLSDYLIAGDQRLWIITEADRSVTTLLLPDEW